MNNLIIEKEHLSHLPVGPTGTPAASAFVPISFAGTCSTHHGGDYCLLDPDARVD
jgi:hypothetical protein